MRRRYTGPARKDGNHSEIERVLRTIPGLVIEDCSAIGPRAIPGWPDLMLLWRGAVYCIEIKTGPGEPLTAGEEQLHARWRSAGVRVHVVWTADQVLRLLGFTAPAFSPGG